MSENSFTDFINQRFAPTSAPMPPAPPAPPAPPIFIPPPAHNVVPPVPGQTFSIPPPPPPAPRPLTEESDDTRTHDFLAQTIGAKAVERILGVVPPPMPPEFTRAVFTPTDGRPEVEHGFINSPEGGKYAPASPEEAAIMVPIVDTAEKQEPDQYDAMDRTALKALCIQRGLCTESSRFQEPKLRSLLREAGQNVDTSEEVQTVSHQLEANRDVDESVRDVGLTSEEQDAIKIAAISITDGQSDELDKLEGMIARIVTERLEHFFSQKFGR